MCFKSERGNKLLLTLLHFLNWQLLKFLYLPKSKNVFCLNFEMCSNSEGWNKLLLTLLPFLNWQLLKFYGDHFHCNSQMLQYFQCCKYILYKKWPILSAMQTYHHILNPIHIWDISHLCWKWFLIPLSRWWESLQECK